MGEMRDDRAHGRCARSSSTINLWRSAASPVVRGGGGNRMHRDEQCSLFRGDGGEKRKRRGHKERPGMGDRLADGAIQGAVFDRRFVVRRNAALQLESRSGAEALCDLSS